MKNGIERRKVDSMEDERAARLEEAMKGVCRSLDSLRELMEGHIEDEKIQDAKQNNRVAAIELDLVKVKTGSKVIVWVGGILIPVGGVAIAASQWVNKVGAAIKGVPH